MIKLTTDRIVRECTAPYEYNAEDGTLQVEEIRVRYYSLTLAELKQVRSDALARMAEQRERAEKAKANKSGKAEFEIEDFPWLSDQLVLKLAGLPDIGGPDGKPISITVENLDKISAVNLRAIEKAIDEDLAPKDQPSN